MGVYTDRLPREVRLEYLTPEQAEAARTRRPFLYVPFGSIEWHGYHNAVGLDALKAHEQLVGLALRAGGLVYPPVFFGSGGGHQHWPSSFMVRGEPMVQVVTDLLHGFERDGYRKAILLSGHYPNRGVYLDAAIVAYRGAGGTMDVLALVENEAPGVGGDHAALYETSFMMYLHPRLVDGERLKAGGAGDAPPPDTVVNWMDPQFKNHPCYGLWGMDPRAGASARLGQEHTERLIEYLAQWLGEGAVS